MLSKKYALLLLGFLSLEFAGLSFAQSTSALEEIVVTATRRESNLQDTGISVQAFSEDMLERYATNATDELARITPGLMLQNAGGAPISGLVSIRGVSQNDFAGHIESPNAMYVDEAYLSATSANSMKMFDIDRVEVLRGPQGTLFGRNATGGLIHIITQNPTDEVEGYAKVRGGEYKEFGYEGVISGPLSDKVSGRLALFHSENDGWFNNPIGPNQLGDDTYAWRAKLSISPSDNLNILLSVEGSDLDLDAAGAAHGASSFFDDLGLGRFGSKDVNNLATGYVDPHKSFYKTEIDVDGFIERETGSYTAKIVYDFGDYSFTSLSNYNTVENYYEEDNDLSPIPWTGFSQSSDSDAFSQEIIIAESEGASRWSAGLYYLYIDGDYTQSFDVYFHNNAEGMRVPINEGGNLRANADIFFADYSLEVESYSGFAQIEHDFTEELTLTAGARWTYDKKDYTWRTKSVSTNDGVSTPVAGGPGSLQEAAVNNGGSVSDRYNEDGVSLRIQADYTVSDDWLLYTSFNKGYKAFNYNASFLGAAQIDKLRYDGETLYAYEAGSKLNFWDGRARFNASVYYYDYQDYQAFDQRGLNLTLFNTDATIYGADAELTWQLANMTSFNFGLSLINTEVEDISIGAGENAMVVDREAPQAADYTVSMSLNQGFDIGACGSLDAAILYYYNDGYFSQLSNAEVTDIPDYSTVDLTLRYVSPDGKYRVSLFAKNMTDEEYYIYAFDISGVGFSELNLGPPRRISVEATYRF